MRHQKQIVITVQYNDAAPVPDNDDLRRSIEYVISKGGLQIPRESEIDSCEIEIIDG